MISHKPCLRRESWNRLRRKSGYIREELCGLLNFDAADLHMAGCAISKIVTDRSNEPISTQAPLSSPRHFMKALDWKKKLGVEYLLYLFEKCRLMTSATKHENNLVSRHTPYNVCVKLCEDLRGLNTERTKAVFFMGGSVRLKSSFWSCQLICIGHAKFYQMQTMRSCVEMTAWQLCSKFREWLKHSNCTLDFNKRGFFFFRLRLSLIFAIIEGETAF